MNELKVINEQEVLGKHFAIYGDLENPLFLAKDVASWIEYSKRTDGSYNVSAMLNSVDEDEKVKVHTTVNNFNGWSDSWFLTENGLYEVLMQSRKPIAKQFKKEVKQILKDIRKHGIYATDNVIDKIIENPDFGISLLSKLKEERAQRKILEQKNEEDRPKVTFANAVATSKTNILIGELAKILKQNGVDIGEKRLFHWLRENGYLIKRRGIDYNAPTQESMNRGLFEVKETVVTHVHGDTTIHKTTRVTGRGQQYFINKFLNKEKE